MPKPAGYDAALSLKASAYLATLTRRKPRVVIEHITRFTATPDKSVIMPCAILPADQWKIFCSASGILLFGLTMPCANSGLSI